MVVRERIYDPDGEGKTKLDQVAYMLQKLVFHKQLPFVRGLMDSWDAAQKLIALIEQLGKIYYCPLKRKCLCVNPEVIRFWDAPLNVFARVPILNRRISAALGKDERNNGWGGTGGRRRLRREICQTVRSRPIYYARHKPLLLLNNFTLDGVN